MTDVLYVFLNLLSSDKTRVDNEVVRLLLARLNREMLYSLLQQWNNNFTHSHLILSVGGVLAKTAVTKWNTPTLDKTRSPSVRHNALSLLADAALDDIHDKLWLRSLAFLALVCGLIGIVPSNFGDDDNGHDSLVRVLVKCLLPAARFAANPTAQALALRGLGTAVERFGNVGGMLAEVTLEYVMTAWESLVLDQDVEKASLGTFKAAAAVLAQSNGNDADKRN